MKTLLTPHELCLYGSYYLETKPKVLCTGTLNQITQWRVRHGVETDKEIRQQYGRSCYTCVFIVEGMSDNS